MTDINEEIITSENDELDGQEEPEMDIEDVPALKQKNIDLAAKNRQLFERAKKAEGFEKVDGKWVKAQKPEPEPKAEVPPQSNEPDYANKLVVKTYLKSEGVDHPDDQKWVQDEAKRLRMDIDEVLPMEHVKSKLQINKEQREALAGMPKGRGTAGGKTQNDVDYWIDQKNPDGSFKTPDDPDLAEKVIDARIKRQEKANKFSDELFNG